MTLEQLQTLVQIVETGSMGAAAKTLQRTQPTLSVSVKKLEQELNLELFSREHHSMTPTPVGQALYQKAKRILERTEEFQQLGWQLAQGNEAKVNIAFSASIPIGLISKVLKNCEADFPNTNLELLVDHLGGTMERLKTKEADLAVVPYFDGDHRFKVIPFLKYNFFPVVASTHPLAQRKKEVPFEILKDHVQVVLTDNASKDSHRVMEGVRQWRVNNSQSKKEIILEGLGWGNLPEFNITKELENHSLVPLKIENYYQSGSNEICIVSRAGQVFGPVVQSLWDSFQALAGIQSL